MASYNICLNATYPCDLWNEYVYADRGGEPHDGQDGRCPEGEFFPTNERVLRRELKPHDDELDSNNDSTNSLNFCQLG